MNLFTRLTLGVVISMAAMLPVCGGQVKDAAYTDGDFRRISAMTAKILERNHYSGVQIDGKLSERIFLRFFDSLDPARMLFSQADLQKFAAYRQDIGSRIERGEYQFAFEVYELYRQRYREFRAYTQQMLKDKVDFTVDETLPTELDKKPRPSDEIAMRDMWRKRIKNDLLLFRMMDRAAQEEEAKNAGKKSDPKSAAKPVAAVAKKTPEQRILQRQRDIGNDIEKRDRIDILGILLDSMARSFGAHSDYQPPKLSEDFNINMSLSLSGIGATLTSENGYIKVVELVPGGPAAKSGKLKVDDRIVNVVSPEGENIDLIDMPVSKAVQYIRGEKGTVAVLGVLSGSGSAVRRVEIVRDKIKLSDGAAKGEVRSIRRGSREVKVGVINLPGFYMDFDAAMRGDQNARRASSDVAAILKDFERKQVDSVVIDLRRNGGGSLPDAIVLSGLFLAGDPVVQTRSQRTVELERDPDAAMAYSGPLVVLTSKFSASAAEIFTGALRDNRRAVVVGDSRTFGKGTILRVESLDRFNQWFGRSQPAGSLTFEMAMFYRPSGSSVQQMGIAPDIKLPSLTEEMKAGEMFMDNHLPWDAIDAVKCGSFDPELEQKIGILKMMSAGRISADANFKALQKRIGQFREIRNRKYITLHEQKRWEEYIREKKVSEEVEALESESAEKDKGKKQDSDILLTETVNIAADLFMLDKKEK
ncbi:MAG: carboxy terminal-processing peptidase [Lentisphaeria bacterium]|nr:carboxy terminal-processing peptidase [Lentisphaeria bacterium]